VNRARRRGAAFVAGLTLAALLLAAGLTALGVWQVKRLAWKEALIAQVDSRIHAAPVPAPRSASPDQAYLRIAATGRFLHDKSVLVGASTERGTGYWVMTPLVTDRGFTLLVNRGFVPADARDAYARPPGPLHVVGLLRPTEPKGDLLRSNAPAQGRWYSRDVAAIAADRRLPGPVAPYFIDAQPQPGETPPPYAGLTVVRFPNNHLVYAITWFALAAMTLAAYGVAMTQDRKTTRA
jgi:surfeit locus 1 family protein